MKMTLQIEASGSEIPGLIRGIAEMGFTQPIIFNLLSPGTDPEAFTIGEKVSTLGKSTFVPSLTGEKGSGRGGGYVVTHHRDGNYSCSCPAWKHNVTRPCKHIFRVWTNNTQKWGYGMKESEVIAGEGWVRWVTSTHNADKVYRVEGAGDRALSCTCPDHVHRQRRCKHMIEVEQSLKN